MTGNKNKQDMANVAKQVEGTRSSMEQFRPEYAKQRSDIASFRNTIQDWGKAPREDTAAARTAYGSATDTLSKAGGDVGKQREFYTGMLNDPSKRGYGEDTVNKMYAKLAGASQTAKTDLTRGLTKATAASGMGNTGAAMRNVMTANERLSSDLLGAQRDVDIGNAMASREDLWGAAKGLGETSGAERDLSTAYQNIGTGYGNLQGLEDRFKAGVIGAEGQTLDQNMAALQGENQLFGTMLDSYNPQLAALQQKNRPGFWGNFGSAFAGSLGQSLGRV